MQHTLGLTRGRDRRGTSSHLQLPWTKLVSEPGCLAAAAPQSCSCWFSLCSCNLRPGSAAATFVYSRVSRRCYKLLTNVIIVIISLVCGLLFGCLAFCHVWILTPTRKVIVASQYISVLFTEFYKIQKHNADKICLQ